MTAAMDLVPLGIAPLFGAGRGLKLERNRALFLVALSPRSSERGAD